MMVKPCAVAIGSILLGLAGVRTADAAELAFVLGTLVKPDNINEGDAVAPGTVIQSGSDALVIVEHRWPSDVKSRDCVLLVIFGYGQSYVVSEAATPGRCEATVPSNPASLGQGQPFLSRETRYGDAKFDEPAVPAAVAASQARWRAFDDWLRSSQRSFTGVVTAAGGGTIRVRSAVSARERAFSVTASTESAVAPDALVNARVRIDYQGPATGRPRAVRIRRLDGTGQVVKPQPIPGGTAVIDPKSPVAGRPLEPDPGAGAAASAERWLCTIDLHQGDRGTLRFERTGTELRGSITVRDGSLEHAVSGVWEADRVSFRRTLSAGSSQPFIGVAAPARGGRVRLAGRFANDYAGIWSADCEPGADANERGPAAASALVDVVLMSAGADRVAVIRAVRAMTGLGLRDAAEALDQVPFTVKSAVTAEEAESMVTQLRNVGATVNTRPAR